MSNKLESWIAENLPFLYAIVLALWGGFVQYANRVRVGEKWSWSSMFLDLVVCSFAGVLSFFFCQVAEIYGWKAAIVIAVSAHEGTRAIGLMTRFRDRVIGIHTSRMGEESNEKSD